MNSIIAAETSPAAQALSSEEQITLEQIRDYLAVHVLSVFFREGKFDYTHLAFQKDFWNNNAYAIGKMQQDNKSFYTLFTVSKTWFWHEIQTEFMYITNDNPLPSPLLVTDITKVASNFQGKDLSNYHLFIAKSKNGSLQNGSKLQQWLFFNIDEAFDFDISLTDDGYGGTYFYIRNPLKQN
ncbi:MAG: hypothetical protein KAR79_03355 [Simkaniaceae bacterium]|nr:hypothetical protein [Simkaniaceae bacterium]